MTRKRSSYRPKGINPQAFQMAMRGICFLDTVDQLKRAAPVRMSVELLVQSKGNKDDWRAVFYALNMLAALARIGVVRHANTFVSEQATGITALLSRHLTTGSNVLRSLECQLLRDLSAVWADVLAVVTCSEFYAADMRVTRTVAQASTGGRHPSVQVLKPSA